MTNEQFAFALADLLGITAPADRTELVEIIAGWTGGEMTPLALANRVSQFVSLVSGRDMDLSDWAHGTVNGGPANDGEYPIRIQGGGTITLPSPAKMVSSTQKGDPGGVRYVFSTTTADADPGNGRLRFSHVNPALVTKLFYDNQEANGGLMTPWFATFGASSSDVKGLLVLQQGSAGPPLVFRVTSAPIARAGYYEIPVSHVAGATLPDNNAGVTSLFSPTGDHGDSLRYGAGEPAPGLGVNGDIYLRLDTGDYFGPKTGGGWGVPILQTTVASLLAQAVAARDVATGAATTSTTNAGLTNADRIATASDRTQTGLDRIQTGLDRSGAAGDRFQTGLDRTQTGLDRIQTGLDAGATAADRLQTGSDRDAAALSAGAAEASALSVNADLIDARLNKLEKRDKFLFCLANS